jgi:phage-related holin
LALVLVTAMVDYVAGTLTAHVLGEYKSGIAYTGFLSKLLGLVLLMVVRLLEGFVAITGFVDSRGALATAAAVSLIAVDIVSIAKHRARLGGEPIPFTTALTDWLQSAILEKLPGRKPKGDAGGAP